LSQSFSLQQFTNMPVVGIMRNISQQHAEKLAIHYAGAGFGMLEVTMNSPGAASIISQLIKTTGDRLHIGAGTVCTTQDMDTALAAGAQFIVTPILNEAVIKACVHNNIPVFPGAYTPTEIYTAWSMGATMVKVFPATQLGPNYIKEVLAPLNQIKLMPTGGVTIDNFTGFLKAGASAVALGSNLFPMSLIERGDWTALDELFTGLAKRYYQFKEQG
jgi:2-dehydro-3-deoxyphosphogluconate aldolase/(4S)-4-hydroxy-2-oxoglutarate aldolase